MLALSQRYYRRALYGAAVLLSIAIIASTSLFVLDAIRQFKDQQIDFFVQKTEQVQSQAERLTEGLSQFVDLYEGIWWLRGGDAVPVERYRGKLAEHQGAVTSDMDLTAMPFSIVTSLNDPHDAERLATMLRLVRDVSAVPSIDAHRVGITLFGFLYSPDGKFIAMAPPLADAEMDQAKRVGVQPFVAPLIAPFEPMLRNQSAAALRGMRPLWISAESDGHAAGPVAHVVLPVLHGDARVATIVVSLPESEFLRYFLDNQRPPGFFVFGQRHGAAIGEALTRDSDARLLAAVKANDARLAKVSSAVTVFRSGSMLFVARRIVAPNWLAVYVIDWRDILGALRVEVIAGTLVFLGTLCFLWGGVIFFDRRIGRPLQRDAMKLIEAEQFSQAIIDTLPVGIAVYIPDEKAVLLENTVATRMLGNGSLAERIRFYREVVRACDDASTQSGAAFPERARHAFVEAQWELGGGRETHIGVALSETRFAGRDVLLLGLVDINERKANELLLHEAKTAADRANQAKSMFLAVMSHEIRTPLHGALGHLELLSQTPLSTEQGERVTVIRRAFDNLLGIVNDILDVTKIEADALKLNPEPLCLNVVLEQCAQNFAATILQRNLAFCCETDPALDVQVEADAQRITQVVQNLLSNAAKFTEAGRIVLSSKLLPRQNGRLWARIAVADSGIGIPAALQSSLFKPLAQADDTISRSFGGTGLGLFLCRNLADLMGGRMTLVSEPGVGSVFALELPVAMVRAVSAPADQPLSGLTVEVVCERPAWKQSLAARLAGWGATVLPDAGPGGRSRVAPQVRLYASTDAGAEPPRTMPAATLGVVVASPGGPLVPQRRGRYVGVTSLSSASLLLALQHVARDGGVSADAGVPLAQPATQSAAQFATRAGAAEAIWQPDILVAEDEPLSRMLIAHQLHTLGYKHVREARNGREALEMWRAAPADVTITDLSMPELDGVGLLREIRAHDPHALVVAATAARSSDAPAAAAGFSHVLNKPVSLADLRWALTALSRAPVADPMTSTDIAGRASPPPLSIDLALREAFAHSWKEDRALLEEALRAAQPERLRRRLHRLHGALLTLGADAVAADCGALEAACATADWAELRSRCEQLIAKLDVMAR